MSLLQMGLSGSILILCIVLIRPLAIHKLPKTVFVVLWEIAALRLLLPVSIPLPFSILSIPNIACKESSVISGQFMNPFPTPSSIPTQQTGFEIPFFAALWSIGTAVLGAWFLVSYVRSIQKFKMSLPDTTPAAAAWLKAHSGIRQPEIRSSDRISSPLTYGIFHPVILLPKKMDRTNEESLVAILTHEYVHIQRLDGITKLIFAGVLCLHWWNPFVWILYTLANRDMELSCDAAVIQRLGASRCSSYALALLSMEEARSSYLSLQNHFCKNAISERIEAIMKFKKASAAAITLAAVLTIGGATAAFATESIQSPLNGAEFDLDAMQSVDLKDGTILYLPKSTDVNLEKIEKDLSMRVLYDTTSDTSDTHEPMIEIIDPKATEYSSLGSLISVSHKDKHKFTPEQWTNILSKIEKGEIVWED